MKTKLPLLLCLFVFLTTPSVRAQKPSAPDASVWKSYMIRGEDFTAAFPLLPAVDIKIRTIRELNISRREVLVGCYADGVAYTVYAIENPKSRRSLDEFIRDHMGEGPDLPVGTELTRDGLPGKQFVFPERHGMTQFFTGKDRHYKFSASSLRPNDPRMTKFFESLKFGKPGPDTTEMMDGPGLPYEPVNEPTDAATDVTTQKLLTGKEVDRKIRLALKPEPVYTESARQNQVTGTVVLKCVFTSNGNITNMKVISGLPNGLTENALDAASKIKFLPAIKDGKPVSMWIQLEYNFNLY